MAFEWCSERSGQTDYIQILHHPISQLAQFHALPHMQSDDGDSRDAVTWQRAMPCVVFISAQ
jgi:hypothetical protein